jgi:hypothetical protein
MKKLQINPAKLEDLFEFLQVAEDTLNTLQDQLNDAIQVERYFVYAKWVLEYIERAQAELRNLKYTLRELV